MIKLKSLLFENILDNQNFKKWFGNSKVVDKNGNPLVVYHGSNSVFTKFSLSYTKGQIGFHLGTKNQAKNIRQNISHMYKLYASIKNPIKLEDLGSWYGQHVVSMINKILGTNIHDSAGDDYIRRVLQSKGYDGVIYKNKFEGVGNSYIAFEPNQIKSVENNNGEFSITNSDITK